MNALGGSKPRRLVPARAPRRQAIDSADTGEGPAGVKLPVLKGEETLDASLFNGSRVRPGDS